MKYLSRQHRSLLVPFIIVTMFNTSCTGTGTVTGNVKQTSFRHWENVSDIMDSNKDSIYATYNEFVRKDPNLAGKVVLELTIEASGTVKKIKIISSELDKPEFIQKLKDQILDYKFGAKKVGTLVATFHINFPPKSKWQLR